MQRSSHCRCLLLRRRRTMTRTSPVLLSQSPPTSAAAVLRMMLLRVLRRWAATKSQLTVRQAGGAPVCTEGKGRGGELYIQEGGG